MPLSSPPPEPGFEHPHDGIVYPTRLGQPQRPPALVYLDLNHFINLARASQGRGSGEYSELLNTCRRCYAQGLALFPLSATHAFEMSGIADPNQRRRVAEVMEELSGFRYLLDRSVIARLEIESAIEALAGLEPISNHLIPLIGNSLGWALGKRGGLKLLNADGTDGAPMAKEHLGEIAFNKKMAQLNIWMERALLTGPSDSELPDLRANGYAPESAWAITEKRAAQEREQAARLDADPKWRKGRLRDVIAARELIVEWADALTEATAIRNFSIGRLLDDDQQRFRQFSDCMPTNRVAVALKVHYHRNSQHNWTRNDIHDIDALAVALPYCDAVFTDKAARNALTSAHEHGIFGTAMPRNPAELSDWLEQLMPA
jgi:hypothetical protein